MRGRAASTSSIPPLGSDARRAAGDLSWALCRLAVTQPGGAAGPDKGGHAKNSCSDGSLLVFVASGACGPEAQSLGLRPDGGKDQRGALPPAPGERPAPAREVGGPDGGTGGALPAERWHAGRRHRARRQAAVADAGAPPQTRWPRLPTLPALPTPAHSAPRAGGNPQSSKRWSTPRGGQDVGNASGSRIVSLAAETAQSVGAARR